jgi:hypothetical protein
VQEVTLRLAAPAPIRIEGRLLGPDGRPLTFDHPYLAGFTPWELRDYRDTHSDRSFTVHVACAETSEIGTTFDEFLWKCGYGWCADVDLSSGRWSVTLDSREEWPSSVALVARDRVVAAAPIAALPDGGAPHDASCRTLAGPDLRVEADASTQPCEIELRIRVLDAATRACFADPRQRIYVAYFHGGQYRCWSADAPDPASLTSKTSVPFAAGLCRVLVECPGFMSGAVDLDVQRRAEPYELTIPLEHAVRAIRGVVVDGAGRPIQDATSQLFDEDGEHWRRAGVGPATSSKDGRIEFDGVGASRKRLAITVPGFAAACVDLPGRRRRPRDDDRARARRDRAIHRPSRRSPRADERRAARRRFRRARRPARHDPRSAVHRRLASWPRSLTLAPGAYEWSIEFADGTGDAIDRVAAEGTEIAVTPRAR